jgi:type I restriction enzyme M protein
VLADFAKVTADAAAVAAVREKLGDEHCLTDDLLAGFRDELAALEAQADAWQAALQAALDAADTLLLDIQSCPPDSSFATRKALQARLEAVNPQVKAALAALEARHKAWLKLLESAEKQLRARQWPRFAGETAREVRKALLPRDVKKREKPTVRDLALEACKRASYFIAQGHWLLGRFPNGWYDDVPGLCKVVSQAEIAANDWSLTPGRYVGSAAAILDDDDGEGFRARMKEIHDELAELNETAQTLAAQIQAELAELAE